MTFRRRIRRPLLNALARLVPPLLRVLLRALQATLRIDFSGAAALHERLARGEHAIVAFWHSRQILLAVVTRGAPLCIMVSQHRDGELATRTLSAWNVSTVRGSATRGGVGAFLRLVDAYRAGQNVGMAPDGPRGPLQVVKPGVIRLGKVTGGPIYPSAFAASRAVHLNSWDRMVIPLPFARVRIEVGEPVSVPADADDAELEACRAELERRLNAITRSAAERLDGAPPVVDRRSRGTTGDGRKPTAAEIPSAAPPLGRHRLSLVG